METDAEQSRDSAESVPRNEQNRSRSLYLPEEPGITYEGKGKGVGKGKSKGKGRSNNVGIETTTSSGTAMGRTDEPSEADSSIAIYQRGETGDVERPEEAYGDGYSPPYPSDTSGMDLFASGEESVTDFFGFEEDDFLEENVAARTRGRGGIDGDAQRKQIHDWIIGEQVRDQTSANAQRAIVGVLCRTY